MNEKLSNLSKTVDLAKLDLRTIKSESTADNQTLISDNVSILESSVSEAMLKVANLEKTSERQLVVFLFNSRSSRKGCWTISPW